MTLFEQFKAFAKAKPRDEEYDHEDNQNCAVAQFAKSIDPLFCQAGYSYYLQLVDGANSNYISLGVEVNTRRGTEFFNALLSSRTWGDLSDKLEPIRLPY